MVPAASRVQGKVPADAESSEMEIFLYLDRKTVLHKLDPRTKIVCLLGFFVLPLLFNHPLPLLGLLILTLGIALFGKALVNLWRIRWLLILLFLLSSILWTFLKPGKDLLVRLGVFKIWRESLLYGVGMGLRLNVMIISGMIFLSCTMIEEFTVGMRRLGLPFAVSFAFSTAFRLVPTLLGATATIIQAQKSRGLDLESGNIFSRIKKHIPLLIPVLACAIRNAHLFAMALESKGFGYRKQRTEYLELNLRSRDFITFVCLSFLLGLCIYLRAKGIGIIGF